MSTTEVISGALTIKRDDAGRLDKILNRYGNTVIENLIHKSVLTLAAEPVTLTDDPGVGQFGSIKLFDFPAGNIVTLGAVIDATLTLDDAWWVDNIPGDVGLGTTACADAQIQATTIQNIIATTPVAALAAQAGPISAQSAGVGVTGAAGGTDADLILNLRLDDSALHMPDLVTNGAFTTDASWTKETGWTIDGGNSNKADCSGAQVFNALLSQTIATLTAGVSYILTYTTTCTAGTITPLLGGVMGAVQSTADTFTETIIAGSTGALVFRADPDFVGSVDTVSLTPVTGTGSVTGTVTVVWMNAGDF